MGFLMSDEFLDEFAVRALTYTNYGGADLGECISTAKRVQGGDVDSNYQAWVATGDRLFAIGQACEQKGHRVSAREAYLRASTYCRSSYFPLYARPIDPRLVAAFDKEAEAFAKAAALMDPPGQPLEIPFEGTTLPGYLFTVDGSGTQRPTIVCTNGYDSTIYEMYFGHAVAALRRGYNVLLFDGPGQGRVLFKQGLYMRPDWEHVVTPVIDHALTLPEVDPKRIVLLGWSFGGYLAPRAAASEHRIAALIADPGQWDLGEAFRAAMPFPDDQKAKFPNVDPAVVQPVLDQMMQVPRLRWTFEQRGTMVHGVDTIYDYFKEVMDFKISDRVHDISCPTLITKAENDPVAAYSQTLYDALTCPKTLLEFTAAEGAGDHCEAQARTLYHQRTYDWLDETLADMTS